MAQERLLPKPTANSDDRKNLIDSSSLPDLAIVVQSRVNL